MRHEILGLVLAEAAAFVLLVPPVITGLVPRLGVSGRFALVLDLGLVLAATGTLERFRRDAHPERLPRWLRTLAPPAAALFLLGLHLWAYQGFQNPADPRTLDALRWSWLRRHVVLAALGALVLAVGAGKRWIGGTMALLIGAELLLAHGPANPAMPRRLAFPKPPLVTALQEAMAGAPDGARMVGVGTVLLPNVAAAYGLSDARVFSPMTPKRYLGLLEPAIAEWRGELPLVDDRDHPSLYDLLAVRWVVAAPGEPCPTGTEALFVDPTGSVCRRPGATSILRVEGRGPTEIRSSPGGARWRARFSAGASGHLDTGLANLPGWRLLADGKPITEGTATVNEPLYGAELLSRTVQVDLLYRPRGFIIGMLLTVSLHAPYRTPELAAGGGPLLSALRYVDQATSSFYTSLERRGYFESGHLLVVGDHRRMTPLEPRERADLGLDSLGRVFGCLVGPGVPPGSLVDTPLNQTDLFEMATDLLQGSFSFSDDLRRYNKGIRNRLETPCTTHLLSAGRGLVQVRRPDREPFTVQIAASPDPFTPFETFAPFAPFAPFAVPRDDTDRRIAAYVVLRTHLLQRRQEAARSRPAPVAEAACDSRAVFRQETLHRLRGVQRYLLSEAPAGFRYDPAVAADAVESALGTSPQHPGADDGGAPESWWNPVAARALDLLSRLSALDPGSSRQKWLQRTYDLIAVAHAFEVLSHDQRATVARTLRSLDRADGRPQVVTLWSGIRRTFRSNLERPRTEELCRLLDLTAAPPRRPPAPGAPRVLAHQGGLSRWPANSLEAFGAAYELGADGVECDVRLSGDGEVFVLHDDLLATPEGGRVRASRTTSSRLERLPLLDPLGLGRASSQSPLRLRDLLRALGGRALLWIELKPDGGEELPERVGDLLAERQLAGRTGREVRDIRDVGDVVVSSLSPAMLEPLRRRFPDLLIAYEHGDVSTERVEALGASPDAHRLIVSGDHFSARNPEAFHRARDLGLRTSSFTVNRFDALRHALSEGVDFLQTDRPDRALLLRSGG